MSLTYPTTKDAFTLVAVLPDWGQPIRQATVYRTDITRSRRGLEQRAQRRRKPHLTMDYVVAADGPDGQRRIEAAIGMTRGPLFTPWWPHGLRLLEDMPSDTSATVVGNPIGDEWDESGWVFFWHPEAGQEFRILASRNAQVLTLTATGTHIAFPAGSWAFPVRRCVRERDQATLAAQHHLAVVDRLIFRTL